MTNGEFYEKFGTETQCLEHFRMQRMEQGIACRSCKCKTFYWLKSKKQFQCKDCGVRQGIKCGTLLENSNLPIGKWYEAFHLMNSSKKPVSAKTLEFHLDVHYETAWFLLHKIRIAMGNRNRQYQLEGSVEVDEAMVTVMDLSEEANNRQTGRKRGRGSDQAKVMVMASFDEKKDKKGKVVRYIKHASMEVIDDFKSTTLNQAMSKWICRYSKIYSDNFQSYKPLKKQWEHLESKTASGELAGEYLPVVHQQIGMLKRNILGLYHCVSQLHLQNYLDEFCYKLNRRFLLLAKKGKSIFENIVLQSVRFQWQLSR